MALKGNATRIVGPGFVISTDQGGKAVRSLGLPVPDDLTQTSRSFCSLGQSDCPDQLSCHGADGCHAKIPGAALGYGAFDDPASTAAFGCSLSNDGLAPTVGWDAAQCKAPVAEIGKELESMAGWGTTWSGKYPPWAYNMNTGCPCGSTTQGP
jgi:hypothetical protein